MNELFLDIWEAPTLRVEDEHCDSQLLKVNRTVEFDFATLSISGHTAKYGSEPYLRIQASHAPVAAPDEGVNVWDWRMDELYLDMESHIGALVEAFGFERYASRFNRSDTFRGRILNGYDIVDELREKLEEHGTEVALQPTLLNNERAIMSRTNSGIELCVEYDPASYMEPFHVTVSGFPFQPKPEFIEVVSLYRNVLKQSGIFKSETDKHSRSELGFDILVIGVGDDALFENVGNPKYCF